jgi:hypothetical protein
MVSDARFSVYEWKKEAFDPLSTPDITIPYREPAFAPWPPATWVVVKGWAESLSMPVAVAAGRAVCITLGAVAFSYLGKAEQQVASNIAVPAVKEPETIVQTKTEATEPSQPMPTIQPVTASTSRPGRVIKRTPPERFRPANFLPNRLTEAQNAPALTPDQEPDDNSLRLADLFDEVGG